MPESMTYAEWKKQFLSKEELKSSATDDKIVDIKFKSQKAGIEVREDKNTVIEAYATLPPKVQSVMADVTVDLGTRSIPKSSRISSG